MVEAVRYGFNLTEVANALHTSQPGVSRQIRELEEELGVEIFIRSGKRLVGLTREGKTLLPMIEQLLQQINNLRRASQDLHAAEEGTLSIAATHSQARYVLPHVVRDFRKKFPRIVFHLHQGSPHQVAEMLLSGLADIGVATEALAEYDRLYTFPCYRWTHSVVVPLKHPLLELKQAITLNDLAQFPIITYELGYTGRSHIDAAFKNNNLNPKVVLSAMDADVIKTYVELEMGVGIIASVAWDDERDTKLRVIDVGHLFEINTTRLGIARNHWLPGFAYAFIETFVPSLTPEVIQQTIAETATTLKKESI